VKSGSSSLITDSGLLIGIEAKQCSRYPKLPA
jgi:hypothetical protein